MDEKFSLYDDDEKLQICFREDLLNELNQRGVLEDFDFTQLIGNQDLNVYFLLWNQIGHKVGLETFLNLTSRYFLINLIASFLFIP